MTALATRPTPDGALPEAPGAALGRLGVVLTVGGALGGLAATVLTVERFRLAEDPGYVPSCSLDPVLSCGSVMTTPQAALLGFPNSLVGMVAFAVATTLGVLLLAGVGLPRWVLLGLQVGLTAGLALVAWLVVQSLLVIGALCPYCAMVWAVTIPMFWSVTLGNAASGVLPVPRRARAAVAAVADYGALVTVTTWAVLATAVAVRFWDHWTSLLG